MEGSTEFLFPDVDIGESISKLGNFINEQFKKVSDPVKKTASELLSRVKAPIPEGIAKQPNKILFDGFFEALKDEDPDTRLSSIFIARQLAKNLKITPLRVLGVLVGIAGVTTLGAFGIKAVIDRRSNVRGGAIDKRRNNDKMFEIKNNINSHQPSVSLL